MRLAPAVIALLLALTPAVAAASPTTSVSNPAPAATREARALAGALVSASGDRENEVKALDPVEGMLSSQIAMRLSTTDPGVVAKVNEVVHGALSTVVQKSVDALVEGYASSLSTDELGHIIAFVKSPAGQAEKANLPLLKQALAAALNSSDTGAKAGESAAQVFAAASPEQRALVLRILTAQDFEAHTRQGYATLGVTVKAALSRSGVRPPGGQPGSEADAKAADASVRLATEIEEGFCVSHYTNAELAEAAAYLESEPGQALLTRLPKVKGAIGAVLAQALADALSSLPAQVCTTVACSPDQRTRLAELMAVMAAVVSSLPSLNGSPG